MEALAAARALAQQLDYSKLPREEEGGDAAAGSGSSSYSLAYSRGNNDAALATDLVVVVDPALPAPAGATSSSRAREGGDSDMDLGGHEDQDIPIPISAQFSAAAIHETAAKLKLLASGNGTPVATAANQVVVASGAAADPAAAVGGDAKGKPPRPVRYRECLKNHAAGIGGHALDGCGEFMPCGEEGTLDGLKCAACDCHRNFHRREVEGEPSCIECHHRKDKKRLLMLPSSMDEHGGGGGGGGGYMGGPNMKKRFRTKFTGDQKERMLAFADKVGWKIQKHDEADVQQFCSEVGVKRHVLKVWMHNNKHTLGKSK